MGCVLKAYGADFQVDRFLEASELTPCVVRRRGEPFFTGGNPQGKVSDVSRVHIVVSEADFDNLPDQIQDTISFLEQHRGELARLCKFPDVEGVFLDFGIDRRDVAVQYDDFPAELLYLAGSLGISIRVSSLAVELEP